MYEVFWDFIWTLKIILKVQLSLYMYISDGNGDFEIGCFTSQGWAAVVTLWSIFSTVVYPTFHCEHFWLKSGPFLVNLKITQLPCFLASFKISEYFYVDIGLFSFKNAIENLLRQFSKKLKKKFFFNLFFTL